MARYGRNGHLLRETHEKSMWRYERHAWSTALDLAGLLAEIMASEGLQLADARRLYDAQDAKKLADHDRLIVDTIAAFVVKTPSQWPGVLRKLFKGKPWAQRAIFLTLAILACLRAQQLIDLRDSFRTALAPGRGYRATTAEMVLFGTQVADLYVDYSWPHEVFFEADLDDGRDDGQIDEDQ
jgi:hypothetical protein